MVAFWQSGWFLRQGSLIPDRCLTVRSAYQTREMIHNPRPPCPVSLTELITLGYLSENDVSPDGHVDESRRCSAEQQFLQTRPRTAPPERRRRPLRHPPPPPPTSRPQTARGSSAHFHRIHIRREVKGTNDKIPARLVLDTCCICYTNSKDHAIVPCFHMCVCSACSQRIHQCPMCRGPVDRIQRIFM